MGKKAKAKIYGWVDCTYYNFAIKYCDANKIPYQDYPYDSMTEFKKKVKYPTSPYICYCRYRGGFYDFRQFCIDSL